MDSGSLVAELKRRRVVRALVGYGIGAFAVLQIVEPIMHGFRWPDEVLSYVVVALALGFPVVVTLAWIFDVNAGRIERTQEAAHGSAWLQGPRLALLLVGLGLCAATPGLLWFLAGPGHQTHARSEPSPPAPALAEQIDQTLGHRGLSFEDLAEINGARVERGKQALTNHDANGAADLLAFAAAAPITPEILRKKLDRLDGVVASRARTLGGAGGLLEDKYLGLYKAVKAGLGPKEYEHLSRQVADLERELSRPAVR